MMTCTALGHTGRALVAERAEVLCYVLVLNAAVVRVFAPMLWPGHYLGTVLVAALLWCGGFRLYAIRYWPFLTRPRIDGKPG